MGLLMSRATLASGICQPRLYTECIPYRVHYTMLPARIVALHTAQQGALDTYSVIGLTDANPYPRQIRPAPTSGSCSERRMPSCISARLQHYGGAFRENTDCLILMCILFHL